MSSLTKAFEVVNLFQVNSRGITVLELSRALDISVRQAYRYLAEMAIHFPVTTVDAERGRYRLMGSKAWKA